MRTVSQQIALAKRWGNAHGYEGREGGWIYMKIGGKPVCQGWWAFYQRHQAAIEREDTK